MVDDDEKDNSNDDVDEDRFSSVIRNRNKAILASLIKWIAALEATWSWEVGNLLSLFNEDARDEAEAFLLKSNARIQNQPQPQ